MYVFVGEHVALVDFVKVLHRRGLLEKGEYVVISVDDEIYDPESKHKIVQRGAELTAFLASPLALPDFSLRASLWLFPLRRVPRPVPSRRDRVQRRGRRARLPVRAQAHSRPPPQPGVQVRPGPASRRCSTCTGTDHGTDEAEARLTRRLLLQEHIRGDQEAVCRAAFLRALPPEHIRQHLGKRGTS